MKSSVSNCSRIGTFVIIMGKTFRYSMPKTISGVARRCRGTSVPGRRRTRGAFLRQEPFLLVNLFKSKIRAIYNFGNLGVLSSVCGS